MVAVVGAVVVGVGCVGGCGGGRGPCAVAARLVVWRGSGGDMDREVGDMILRGGRVGCERGGLLYGGDLGVIEIEIGGDRDMKGA